MRTLRHKKFSKAPKIVQVERGIGGFENKLILVYKLNIYFTKKKMYSSGTQTSFA